MSFPRKFHLRWSTIMVMSFAVVLAMVGFFAEVFQAPSLPQEMAQLIKNPLPVDKLQHLRTMSFTNKAGTFKFENTNPSGLPEGPWRMLEPTSIKARKDFFVKVIQALTDIQVRNVHQADSINTQSFSLDKPLFSLVLGPIDGAPIEISFGLLNPIDNTTYFSVKDQDWIYQSLALPLPLDTVTADELLDAKALAFNLDEIESIELSPNDLKLVKMGTAWENGLGQRLDSKKVEGFLKDLLDLKSYMVLDKLDASQNEAMKIIMHSPKWRLQVSRRDISDTYYVSAPLDRVGSFKLDKSGSALLYREGTLSPIVLDREQLNVFNRKERDLK